MWLKKKNDGFTDLVQYQQQQQQPQRAKKGIAT